MEKTGDGREYQDEETAISSNFECGNGEDITRVAQDHFSLRTRGEHVDWGTQNRGIQYIQSYFCVRIRNRLGIPTPLKLDIHGEFALFHNAWARRGNKWNSLPTQMLSTSNDKQTAYVVRVFVDMDAHQTVYVSNSFWYPPSDMAKWLEAVAEDKSALCTLDRIGESAQGRPINVLTISDHNKTSGKNRVAVAASPQASEMGAWACRGLIDYLLSDDQFAGDVRKRWVVDVIPQTNPDGEALGTVMVNSLGENPLIEFDEVARNGVGSVEASSLWKWIEEHLPALYLEYHSYYQANRPSFRPYLFSLELYTSERCRRTDEAISRSLLSISTGGPQVVNVGNQPFSKTLPYQLIQKSNVISHFYKLHNTKESLGRNLEQATRVFKVIVDTYEKVSATI